MKLRQQRMNINNEVAYLQQQLSIKQKELAVLDKRIALEDKAVTVSDHALVRYLERAMGFNLNQIRDKMLSDTVRDAIEAGASGVSIDNVKFVVKDKTIITTLDK
jgi:hypothetical protein